jgi:hydrogenase expression/formation protein HypE
MILSNDSSTAHRSGCITLAHGGGGQLTDELIERAILPRLGNRVLEELLDSAQVQLGSQRLAMTIDSYVVQPLFFPGGDIGRLCISGTVNDLLVSGARPLGIALALILAEGLERNVLNRVLESISVAAREADVRVLTGDTKVVDRAHGDGIYITTAGIGVAGTRRLHPDQVRAGDVVIISGSIADHGLAVMLAREMPQVTSVLTSDVAPLTGLLEPLLDLDGIAFMRDPTRGGLAGLAADLARRSGLHVTLDEDAIPLHPHTLHAAEMLGIDPLDVANEGKVVVVCRPETAARCLSLLKRHPLGAHAAVIGTIEEMSDGLCEIRTRLGGRRILQKPYGEQLPRIC